MKDQAAAQAEAIAAAQVAAQVSEQEVAAELKAKDKDEAAVGLMAAHKSADEERLRKKEEATVKIKVESNKSAKINKVFAYRVFKNNPQWCVEWTADHAVSWETWDKLDSEQLRETALELTKSVTSEKE